MKELIINDDSPNELRTESFRSEVDIFVKEVLEFRSKSQEVGIKVIADKDLYKYLNKNGAIMKKNLLNSLSLTQLRRLANKLIGGDHSKRVASRIKKELETYSYKKLVNALKS